MKSEEKSKIIARSLELVKNAVRNGMSNYEIAKQTNINESTIGNYVNDKTSPTFANANVLIRFFESLAEPDYIYHYTTVEGLLAIFSSSSLKFSDFSHSDDLRERMLYEESGIGVKYICFCCGRDAGNKPAMWAKYAKNDTGVCIKFDLKKLLEMNKGGDFEHFKIKYVESEFIKTGQDVDWIRYKNDNWSYQGEYRFISGSMDSIAINRDCVKWVSFGKEPDDAGKRAVELFQSAGLSDFNIFVRGEHIESDLTGQILMSWDELRERSSALYKEMIEESDNNVEFVAAYTPDNFAHVRFVSIDAAASFVESLYGSENDLEYIPVIREEGEFINDDYLVFQVKGDSMEPTIPNGARILAKRIDEGKWEYADGVVVVVYNKILTIKRVSKNMLYDNNSLLLKADNTKHGEMAIQRCEIRGMWKAERIINQKIV